MRWRLIAVAGALGLGGCTSFEVDDPGNPSAADAAVESSDASAAVFADDLCVPSAEGGLNPPGDTVMPTGTYTTWYWPQSSEGFDSFEWLFGVDRDPANDGYYWPHQFGFAGDETGLGLLGLQAHGLYRADLPDGPIVVEKIAVFAVRGGGLDAALGDILYPDARVHDDAENDWWTIHARFEWVPCRAYEMRVARVAGGDGEDTWYGGFIRDTETGVESEVGRILIPAAWRGLGDLSSMWSQRFGHQAMTECSTQEHSSVLFGIPTANAGDLAPEDSVDRFSNPAACSSSRFTRGTSAVRQEMGVGGG